MIMRFVDMLLAGPGVLLALAIIDSLGPNLRSVIIAVGGSTLPVYAPVIRCTVLSIKNSTFVDAAQVAGCSSARLAIVHILPNVGSSTLVLVTIGVAYFILNGAALSFLGLGVQPPNAEWGSSCYWTDGPTCATPGGSRPAQASRSPLPSLR